jgi:hypothetical protein
MAITGFTIIAGLIQPWWVLWWMSKQNRMLVLKYYGAFLPALFVIYSLFYLV